VTSMLTWLAARVNGRQRPGEPPLLPGTLPFLGAVREFGQDLPALLAECRRQHGDVFTIVVAGKRFTFVLDPLDFPDVLRRVEDLGFDEIADTISRQAFANPHAAQTPALREATHDLYAAHLKAAHLAPLSERFAAGLDARLPALATAAWTPRSLPDLVEAAVFHAGTDALYGRGTADPRTLASYRRLDAAFPLLVAGVPARLLPGVVPAQRWLAARLNLLRADVSAFIAGRNALFAAKLHARDRRYLELGILWAANANTIPAAFWTLAHLLADPVAHAAVRAELDAVLGAGPCGREQLRRMPLLDSAVSEALRLASSSLTIRLVRRPIVLQLDSGGAWSLRQGDRVCLAPCMTHRDPELYPEPERYRHDRFIGAQFLKRGKKVGFALMPYGGGVSMCPGRFLAHEDIKHLVARVVHRLDVELQGPLPPLDQRRAGLGVLPPRGELMARVRARA
jgi:cytochrome P450